ncbi:MAG TPA: Gfo/Idh/MocA family oxidoreductase [Nitrospirales bacterium]|nr:Gfo/Idh/MocA family oxidoreductase [Nitrospirales bacterium]
MKPISIGLIGVGQHGSRYLQHLLSVKTGGELVAISRRNMEEGFRLATKYSLRFYPNYHDLLADSAIQAVLIVTPPSLNLPIALEAIQQGKGVLLEKPLALNQIQGRQIVESANKARIPFMTAQTLRYEPTIQKLQEIASSLGQWQYLVCNMRFQTRPASPEKNTSRNNVGVIMEFGVHLLDLVRVLTQDEVHSVSADIDRPAVQDPEHRAFIKLITRRGLPCYLDISRVSQGRVTRAEIMGSQGQALADWTTNTLQKISRGNEISHYPCASSATLVQVLRDFCQAIRSGSPMPITAEDGLRAVELADACYRSAQIGKPVFLN